MLWKRTQLAGQGLVGSLSRGGGVPPRLRRPEGRARAGLSGEQPWAGTGGRLPGLPTGRRAPRGPRERRGRAGGQRRAPPPRRSRRWGTPKGGRPAGLASVQRVRDHDGRLSGVGTLGRRAPIPRDRDAADRIGPRPTDLTRCFLV